ncbi:MAG: response regulator [Deltaproteobacteria bacterium]|nr:response regulator [Deltaproteobacteria bacterium]
MLTRPRRVLLIEDDPDSAEVMTAMLTMLGHHAIAATCGAAGLARAQDFDPDAVLIDLGLPDMDGCDVARRIRTDAGRRAPLLIAVTAYSMPRDYARTAAAGFAHHVVKPPSMHALESLMKRRTVATHCRRRTDPPSRETLAAMTAGAAR